MTSPLKRGIRHIFRGEFGIPPLTRYNSPLERGHPDFNRDWGVYPPANSSDDPNAQPGESSDDGQPLFPYFPLLLHFYFLLFTFYFLLFLPYSLISFFSLNLPPRYANLRHLLREPVEQKVKQRED